MHKYKTYKNSNIPWIGQIPKHWEVKRLRELCTYTKGLAFKSKDFTDTGVAVVKATDINNFKITKPTTFVNEEIANLSQQVLLNKGNIILSTVGSRPNILASAVGQLALVSNKDSDALLNQNAVIIKSNKNIDTVFFAQTLIAYRFRLYLNLIARGTANQSSIKIFEILNYIQLLPPVSEQKQIAEYLDEKTEGIDKKISLLEKKAATYKELKQSLINQTVTRGLNPSVKLKDSKIDWIGQIPEHWEVKRVGDMTIKNTLKNKGMVENNLLSLSYGSIIKKNINTSLGLLPESFETYQILKNGYIILRLTDLQNDKKSLRVGYVKEPGIITSAYLGLIPDINTYSKYLYLLLHSYDISKIFYWFGGGLRSTMRFDDIKVIPVVLPPLQEQKEIANYLDEKTSQIDEIVSSIDRQVEKLREFRKTLINDVVTGKIKVVE